MSFVYFCSLNTQVILGYVMQTCNSLNSIYVRHNRFKIIVPKMVEAHGLHVKLCKNICLELTSGSECGEDTCWLRQLNNNSNV